MKFLTGKFLKSGFSQMAFAWERGPPMAGYFRTGIIRGGAEMESFQRPKTSAVRISGLAEIGVRAEEGVTANEISHWEIFEERLQPNGLRLGKGPANGGIF